MKTFEGSMTIKWHKNDVGDKRPLTIDVDNKIDLMTEKNRIRNAFLTEGENGQKAHSITFELTERK